jgi:capsular polysaccharide biosynthesis protein
MGTKEIRKLMTKNKDGIEVNFTPSNDNTLINITIKASRPMQESDIISAITSIVKHLVMHEKLAKEKPTPQPSV